MTHTRRFHIIIDNAAREFFIVPDSVNGMRLHYEIQMRARSLKRKLRDGDVWAVSDQAVLAEMRASLPEYKFAEWTPNSLERQKRPPRKSKGTSRDGKGPVPAVSARTLTEQRTVAEQKSLTVTYRDAMGREVGTSATVGSTTVYRDRMGRQTGSATRSGGSTAVYDAMGREIGRAVPTPNLK